MTVILEGKTVLVCGVGQGLGGEIARLCLRDGACVMLAARTEATLEQIAKELDPDGKRVAWQVTDITDDDQCKALAAATVDRFGGIDALVQVAAYDSLFGEPVGAVGRHGNGADTPHVQDRPHIIDSRSARLRRQRQTPRKIFYQPKFQRLRRFEQQDHLPLRHPANLQQTG